MVNYLVHDHVKPENLLFKQSFHYFFSFAQEKITLDIFKIKVRRNNLNFVKGNHAVWKILSNFKMTRLINFKILS